MDVSGEGSRKVKSLGTDEKMEAVQRAAMHAEAKKWTPEKLAARAQERMQWFAETTGTVAPPQITPAPDPVVLGKLMTPIRPRDAVLPGQQAVPTATQIAQEVVRTLKPQPPIVPIEQALNEFVKAKVSGLKRNPNYIKAIKSDVKELVEETGVTNVFEITTRVVYAYIAYLGDADERDKEAVDKTIKNKFGNVRSFLSWCKEVKYIFDHPMEGMQSPSVALKDVEYYSASELEAAFDKIKGHRFENIAGLAATTGLRRGELSRLEAQDVDLAARWIRVANKKSGRVKTRKGRSVPLFDEAIPFVKGLLPRSGLLFPLSDWGQVSKDMTKIGLSLQIMRHSWVTHTLGRVNPDTTARWAGHDIETQQTRYAGRRQGDRAFKFHIEGVEVAPDGHFQVKSISAKSARR